MKLAFGRLLVLTLLFGVVESGMDVGAAATPSEHGGSHEVHSHPGSDPESPDGEKTQTEHYCHCSTHAAALTISVDSVAVVGRNHGSALLISSYHSMTFPPPVPPPNT